MLKFDTDVQRQIIMVGLDDSSPNAMLPNVHGGQYGPTPFAWRHDVVLLSYELLAAGLIFPLPGIENYQNMAPNEIRKLLQEGDPENGFDVDLVWDVIHFSGTKRLLKLLKKFGLDDWEAMEAELSRPFGEALAELLAVKC